MKNVAICSVGELYGGVEEWIYLFAKHAKTDQSDINVVVFLFNDAALAEKLRGCGVEPIIVSARKYDPFVIFRLISLFKKLEIDIVHTHGYKANIACGIAGKLCRLSLVKTHHGEIETSGKTDLSSIRMKINFWLDAVAERLFTKVVFVTKNLMSLRKREKSNWSVIYNSIEFPICNQEAIKQIRHIYKKDSFVVGIVGRISRVKGHIFLLQGLNALKKKIPHLKVWIIGSGPLESELQSYCEANDLRDIVSFFGFQKDVCQYMGNMDILCMPSLHEGLPYTLLESFSFGVPVVASNVGGLAEVLEDKKTALLVPPSDVSKLSASINALYSDKSLRESIASNGRAHLNEHFLISSMVDKYVKTYFE